MSEERDVEFVPVMKVPDVALVPVLEGLLIDAKIDYFVHSANAQNLFGLGSVGGFNVLVGAPTLYVEASQADTARALIEEYADAPFEELEDPEE